jgi:hypothetical protein
VPFLEYHMLQQSKLPRINRKRGYDESLSIWKRLDNLRDLAGQYVIRDHRIRKAIVAAGPCPDLWRVYYAAMSDEQDDELCSLPEYLQVKIDNGTTRAGLGMKYDGWIEKANVAYNSFLDSRDPRSLDPIGGPIGEYYRDRARQLRRAADFDACEKTRFLVKPSVTTGSNILNLTPDGVFSEGPSAAIFESKLSAPAYIEFDYEMTLYALAFEKTRTKDTDSAIVLHSNYPDQHLSTLVRPILESKVGAVSANLERFVKLAEYSALSRKVHQHSYDSWKQFLVRPPGLPTPPDDKPCKLCRFQQTCYREGGAIETKERT